MKVPWYIYLAGRQLKPAGKRLGSVFFILSIIGVGLGVAVLVVVQSVMGGFGQVHRERIIDTSGHLDVNTGGYPVFEGLALAGEIRKHDQVENLTPYAKGAVMVRKEGIYVTPAIYGVPPGEDPVFAISDYLVAGSLEELYDDTVLISQSLSRQLGVWIGSEIEIFGPEMIERLEDNEVVLPRALEVAGVYNIDWNQEFTPGLVCSLRTVQDLYNLEDAVHGIAIRLKDGTNEFELAREIQSEIGPGYRVSTWKELWADFLWVLDLEKTMMLFLNLFIVAVAVFAIANAQLLTVVRKTREIGLLAVLGGKRKGVLGLYCFQGFLIGMLGTVLGTLLAVTCLSFRDPIIQGIASMTGTRDTLIEFYYFAHLPVEYDSAEILLIGFAAVSLSTLASFVPAWRASRMNPAESLRVEQ